MHKIYLPDGSEKEFENQPTGHDIAMSISENLAKACLAVDVDGKMQDLNLPVNDNAKVRLITNRDDEGLEVIRHDTAHILAQAVKRLYGDDVQVTIGPAIDDGFYYDFSRAESFSPEDLEKIEAEMEKIVDEALPIEREIWERDKAVEHFKSIGEHYKAEIIAGIDASEEISLYRQGEFADLCSGPHALNTNVPKAFKLTKLAGAYWRGDSDNEMLQRIYGTAWADKKSLKKYLTRLEEAEKRDHRKLGKQLGLFHMQEEAVGQVFWHDKGWGLYKNVENYIREKLREHNYQEVKTPVLVDRKLWEKSGHWDKFRENMFTSGDDEDGKVLALKPMNCPCHIQIFNQGQKSYKQLPIRMAEFGMCHRNESSGSMHGLMRVRGFVQDDAHIFCTEEQVTSETIAFCKMVLEVYKDFGFEDVKVKFSDRPETRAGEDATWDKAEKGLMDALEATGLEWELNKGEGAFYGPKLEFVLTDAIGRHWQCGTLQLDFVLPERLDASYIGADDKKHMPVMLHRAILGSFERFIGILIEQHAGRFPVWLAPTQVAVCTVGENVDEAANKVLAQLKDVGIRVQEDLTDENISQKIKNFSLEKIPYILTIGNREAENGTVSIRTLGSKRQEVKSFEDFLDSVKNQVKSKG